MAGPPNVYVLRLRIEVNNPLEYNSGSRFNPILILRNRPHSPWRIAVGGGEELSPREEDSLINPSAQMVITWACALPAGGDLKVAQ